MESHFPFGAWPIFRGHVSFKGRVVIFVRVSWESRATVTIPRATSTSSGGCPSWHASNGPVAPKRSWGHLWGCCIQMLENLWDQIMIREEEWQWYNQSLLIICKDMRGTFSDVSGNHKFYRFVYNNVKWCPESMETHLLALWETFKFPTQSKAVQVSIILVDFAARASGFVGMAMVWWISLVFQRMDVYSLVPQILANSVDKMDP